MASKKGKGKRQRTMEQALGLHGPLVHAGIQASVDTSNNIGVAGSETVGVSSLLLPVDEGSKAKKKYNRVFLQSWKIEYPWSFPIVNEAGKERVKCKWCVDAKRNNPFAQPGGASSKQKSALFDHNNSKEHALAASMWMEKQMRSTIPLEKHIDTMVDEEKQRIITVMQIMWYVLKRYLPLEEFSHQCNFQRFLRTPNMPITSEYSAYTSKDAGIQFAKALKSVYWDRLKKEISQSSFYSIQIDESTDISCQQYMILYITYLNSAGNGAITTRFCDLLLAENGNAEALHHVLVSFLSSTGLSLHKLIGIATDGASVMTGAQTGVITRMKKDIPHLLSFHCIAHRESLAAGDAFKVYHEFRFLDKIAKKFYEWACRSAKRHSILADSVKDFRLGRHGKLKLLKMHDVRWLSKGQVMVRLVCIMPALLSVLQKEQHELYISLTNYKVQFLMHFFADVLEELNILNCKLQEENPDISSIGRHLKAAVEVLQMSFLGSNFGEDTKHTSVFIKMVSEQNGALCFKDVAGSTYYHGLHLGPMCEEDFVSPQETLTCVVSNLVSICSSYVHSLVQSLWDRFKVDFSFFEAAKYFSPKDYCEDLPTLEGTSRMWLDTLCKHFVKESQQVLIFEDQCKGERRSFITRMRNCFHGRDMHSAWQECSNHVEWEQAFPSTMVLWRILLVLPLSTVACERGFSKMNKIKDKFRNKLSLEMLGLVMFVGLNTPKLKHPEEVSWDDCFEAWRMMKDRRPVHMKTTSTL